MSERERSDERLERFDIVYQLPPSPQGTYEYEREDGTVVHGDASGEWTLDENGDLEDIVFFASPRWMGHGRKAEWRHPPTGEVLGHLWGLDLGTAEAGSPVTELRTPTAGRQAESQSSWRWSW